MKIGFVGLGSMGRPIARNLADAGHDVVAWNRSRVDSNDIAPVAVVKTVAEALQADVVFTMLADDTANRSVLLADDILKTAKAGTIGVVMATISPELAEDLAGIHERLGLRYISAPVFGTPDVASAGKLNILAAGSPTEIAFVRPLFEIIAKRVLVIGDQPAQVNASKIAGNIMLTMAIEAMAEGIAISRGYGVTADAFIDLMLETQFACRAYQNYSDRILRDNYKPGFKMSLGLTDLRLASDAAKEVGASAPMLAAVRDRMGQAVDSGMGGHDWSAMAEFTLKQNE